MPRRGYRFVPHTADVRFIARGRRVGEAFRNAALAMFETIADTEALAKQKSGRARITVRAAAESYDDLLWKMLQHCLSESSARGLFCYDLLAPSIVRTKSGFRLTAVALAVSESVAASRLEVKGVSKYGLEVRKRGGGFSASVVVDV